MLSKLWISRHQRAALGSVEKLRCVEAQHRDVPEARDWLIIDSGREGMRCVVDDAQSELFGDSLQLFDSTRQSINVNTENACRAVCHETFNSSGVNRHTHWVDVGKNGRDPIPTECVRWRWEREWRCDDLSRKIQRLASDHEGRCAGVNERNVRRPKIGAQVVLKGARAKGPALVSCFEVQISRRCSM